MHDKKTVDEWRKGKPYVLVAGCDWDMQKGYVDVLPQSMDKLPTEDDCCFIIDRYKPLEIRGSARDTIWTELYDAVGKIDLPKCVRTGKVSYIKKFS
jgi:hypothetical protein